MLLKYLNFLWINFNISFIEETVETAMFER